MNPDRVRLDKWLWAARFFKTRTLASEAIAKGRVQVNDQVAKASREVRPGDEIRLRDELGERRLEVLALSVVRGPASVAQGLYAEKPESIQARLDAARQRRLNPELGDGSRRGRPTKRDRRELGDWQRWSSEWNGDPGP